MSRRCTRYWTPLILLLAAATVTAAGERGHVVQPGESVSSIAKRYYGDFDQVDLLLLYNKKIDSRIQAGERLGIPVSEVHEVQAGDTWSVLAERYLGDPAAYPTIALLNDLPPKAPLSVGAKIVMPAVLIHRVDRGETLGELAELYYETGAATEILMRFNGIDDPRRLSAGQTVRVPLLDFRLAKSDDSDAPRGTAQNRVDRPRQTTTAHAQTNRSTPTEPQQPRPQPTPSEPRPRFAPELAEATKAYTDGDYSRARRLLEALRESVESDGSRNDRSELARLLAFTYVAFDLPEEACRAYRRVPGETAFDPDLISPKIRRALTECATRPSS